MGESEAVLVLQDPESNSRLGFRRIEVAGTTAPSTTSNAMTQPATTATRCLV
jgi:hypothetical protein